jgi:hypothetical protein
MKQRNAVRMAFISVFLLKYTFMKTFPAELPSVTKARIRSFILPETGVPVSVAQVIHSMVQRLEQLNLSILSNSKIYGTRKFIPSSQEPAIGPSSEST